MKKICMLINNAVIRANHVWADSRKKVAGVATVVTVAMTMAFCAPTGSLEDIVNKVGTLAFGVLELVGAILLVLGIVAFVKTMTGDDDHGTDQNATSKAIKKIIGGALMVFGPLLVLGWIGATPTTLGTTFFGGL